MSSLHFHHWPLMRSNTMILQQLRYPISSVQISYKKIAYFLVMKSSMSIYPKNIKFYWYGCLNMAHLQNVYKTPISFNLWITTHTYIMTMSIIIYSILFEWKCNIWNCHHLKLDAHSETTLNLNENILSYFIETKCILKSAHGEIENK